MEFGMSHRGALARILSELRRRGCTDVEIADYAQIARKLAADDALLCPVCYLRGIGGSTVGPFPYLNLDPTAGELWACFRCKFNVQES